MFYYYSPPIVFSPLVAVVEYEVQGDGVNIQINPVPIPDPPAGGDLVPPAPYPVPDSGECNDCTLPKYIFDEPFYDYAIGQFENKFPLDILGDIPAGPTGCPRLSVDIAGNDYDYQFCWVADLAAFIKYPIWAAFAISLFIHI